MLRQQFEMSLEDLNAKSLEKDQALGRLCTVLEAQKEIILGLEGQNSSLRELLAKAEEMLERATSKIDAMEGSLKEQKKKYNLLKNDNERLHLDYGDQNLEL